MTLPAQMSDDSRPSPRPSPIPSQMPTTAPPTSPPPTEAPATVYVPLSLNCEAASNLLNTLKAQADRATAFARDATNRAADAVAAHAQLAAQMEGMKAEDSITMQMVVKSS